MNVFIDTMDTATLNIWIPCVYLFTLYYTEPISTKLETATNNHDAVLSHIIKYFDLISLLLLIQYLY